MMHVTDGPAKWQRPSKTTRTEFRAGCLALFLLLSVYHLNEARAQFNGHNTLGNYGLMSGSQLDPGWYAGPFYY